MKVNKKLNELIRYHKELCETSEIHCIITDSDNESFCSDFSVSSISGRNEVTHVKRRRESCWIVRFGENYNVIYYRNFEKIEIKLFPSSIKRIVYKVKQSII